MRTIRNYLDRCSGDRVTASLIIGAFLFGASYASDLILYWRAVAAVSTVVDNVTIAAVGGIGLWLYLYARDRAEKFARAKEHAIIVTEVNYRVRHAVALIARSAIVDDRSARLRQVDEAIDQIDVLLANLISIAGTARSV